MFKLPMPLISPAVAAPFNTTPLRNQPRRNVRCWYCPYHNHLCPLFDYYY